MTAEIKDKQMYLEGYVYQWSMHAYWVCRNYYWKKCDARAITSDQADITPITIFKGPALPLHFKGPTE